MDNKAMYKLSYGLFVLFAREGEKDNGCIINTATQVTDSPLRIAVTVINNNLTLELIHNPGVFNVSILTEKTPFSLFQKFGFQSGRDADKMEGTAFERAENGVPYLTKDSNACISGKVISETDLGTHTMFLADVTDAVTLSEEPSTTYAYYQSHIKPAPKAPAAGKVSWVCNVCGYVYEGEALPEDYICPLCDHGAAFFDKVVEMPKEKKTSWVCTVCGYVYEGEELPEDYICPLCDHGASYFEKIEQTETEPEVTEWVCTVCGYVYEGDELPEDYICPLCDHGVAYFQKLEMD